MNQIDDNPNLPANTIPLDVFNIIPGAAFMLIDQPDPRVWVAQRVVRDMNFEDIYIWAYDGTGVNGRDDGLATERAFAFNWSGGMVVALVGIVVAPEDNNNNDWGVH